MHLLCLRFLLCSLAVCGSTVAAGAGDDAQRPNIVLIVADDVGYSDLGCYGGEIETPHLDRLAADGIRFSEFHVNPMCVVTRTSLMTGQERREFPFSTHTAATVEMAANLLQDEFSLFREEDIIRT